MYLILLLYIPRFRGLKEEGLLFRILIVSNGKFHDLPATLSMEIADLLKYRYTPTILHGVIFHNTAVFIVTAVVTTYNDSYIKQKFCQL